MGFRIWDGYAMTGAGFFCIPICKRANAVAPPTALGTEEWRVPRRVRRVDVMEAAGQLHEVKARVVCER